MFETWHCGYCTGCDEDPLESFDLDPTVVSDRFNENVGGWHGPYEKVVNIQDVSDWAAGS